MSDQTQGDTDLSLFNDDSQSSDAVTEQQEDTGLFSDPKAPPDLGAINRDKQVKVWSDRIESGEATFESLPKNLSWLKPLVQEEVTRRVRTQDVDSLVEAKLAQIRAEESKKQVAAKFEILKAEVNSLELDDTDRKLIDAKFKRLVEKGLSKADALEEAVETFRVATKAGEATKEELKKAMKIPTTTQPVKDRKPEYGSEEFAKTGDSKSRVEEMEKIRKQGGFK